MYSPKIAATRPRVHSGSRNIYERIRMGLNCGKDGMAARVGCEGALAVRKFNMDGNVCLTRVAQIPDRVATSSPPSAYESGKRLGRPWGDTHLFSFFLLLSLIAIEDMALLCE
jgi:hypothetical protein